jgi:hypothetical protein
MTDAKKLEARLIDTALQLIDWADGDVGLARQLWADAFEEAERLDHNRFLDTYDEDEWEQLVREQGERFEKAAEARKKFHVVEPPKD